MSRRNAKIEDLLKRTPDSASDKLALNDKETLFCRWYCGFEEDENGIQTTADPYESALRAGFNRPQAKKAKMMVRADMRIMRTISMMNATRRKSVINTINHYVEDGIEDLQTILKDRQEKSNHRIAAFKALKEMSSYGNTEQEEKKTDRKEFADRLTEIKEVFMKMPIKVTPNANMGDIVRERPPEITLEIEEQDDLAKTP